MFVRSFREGFGVKVAKAICREGTESVVGRTTVIENADMQMKKPELRARRAECSIQMS